jgi:predicted metal-binding membrane protein
VPPAAALPTSFADPPRGGLRAVAPAILALVLAAWLALWLWGASPYARYLSHEYQPSGVGNDLAAFGLFLIGWLVMSIAMMLPTTASLLRDFDKIRRGHKRATLLRPLVVTGFLAAWLATGYLFRLLDGGLHRFVDAVPWLQQRPHLIAAAALFVAGAFEFSALKQRCLTACRSPRSFVYRQWRGVRPRGDALRIGLRYGLSCVGCCWALMLVMFSLGTVNLAWMLGFAAIMAAQKQARFGARAAKPIGVALIVGAVASVALH